MCELSELSELSPWIATRRDAARSAKQEAGESRTSSELKVGYRGRGSLKALFL
jgi:hypothetical protein